MLKIEIPGYDFLKLEVLVLDLNGTLAVDGIIPVQIKGMLKELAQYLNVFVLTSDTFGTVREQCIDLPVQIHVLQSTDHMAEKAAFIKQFNEMEVVAVGNGLNDKLMLEAARLGIAVIGSEGCAARTLQAADIVVVKIEDALNLLLAPKRLIATLRC